MHRKILLRLSTEKSLLREQPHDVLAIHEQVQYFVFHTQSLELIHDILHKHLLCQVHARELVTSLQPDVVMRVEVQVSMTVVFFQRIRILRRRVDISEWLTIVEVDLSHSRNHQSSRLGAVDGLRTVVSQAVGSVINIETLLAVSHRNSTSQQQSEQQKQYATLTTNHTRL